MNERRTTRAFAPVRFGRSKIAERGYFPSKGRVSRAFTRCGSRAKEEAVSRKVIDLGMACH